MSVKRCIPCYGTYVYVMFTIDVKSGEVFWGVFFLSVRIRLVAMVFDSSAYMILLDECNLLSLLNNLHFPIA